MNQSRDWRPRATGEHLALRARLLATAREFFAARHVLEVETPVLVHAPVTDTFINSVPVSPQQWLRTSPEHCMKRLLADHARDIYEIARVFRGDESGRLHQPEFTLVEWYRLGFDLSQLVDDTGDFIRCLLRGHPAAGQPITRLEYRECFRQATGLDPFTATPAELRHCGAELHGVHPELTAQLGDDRSAWLDLLASHAVYPQLPAERLVFVCGYPAEQAMLARLDPDEPRRALRFEAFYNGMELANGFVELQDADVQRRRFEADNRRRARLGLPELPLDEDLLAALAGGLPECAGVAVGFDRVAMLAAGVSSVAQVMSFSAASR